MEARLTADADGAALRAFEQTRGMTGREPLRMRCTGRAFVWLQQPLDLILDKAVPEDCAGMVEHDSIGLVFCRA